MAAPFSAESINLNNVSLLQEAADPRIGAGVVAPVGSEYLRGMGTPGLFRKTGAADTAWTPVPLDIYFNVLDYGATGDGVTDDRLAVQAAIDAAAINGGCVYFPQGTYLCSRVSGQSYSLLITSDNIRLLGSGFGGSILLQTGSAGSTAWNLVEISGGAEGTEIELLAFSQSGLTNVLAGSTASVTIGNGVTGASLTKIIACRLLAGVANADGIVLAGASGNAVTQTWVEENELLDAGRHAFRIGGYAAVVWLVDNSISFAGSHEVEISGAGVSDVKILANYGQSTNSTGLAFNIEGTAADPIVRVTCAQNVIQGAIAVGGLERSMIVVNTHSLAIASSTIPVLAVTGYMRQCQIKHNILARLTGAGNGYCFTMLDDGTDIADEMQIQKNQFIQQLTGQPITHTRSATNVQWQSNHDYVLDAGSSTVVAHLYEALLNDMTNFQITTNHITADAGTWLYGMHFLADPNDFDVLQINSNIMQAVDTGIRFETGGGGTFANELMLAGNNIVATTADWSSNTTLYLRVGANAGTQGVNMWSGAGTPEGAVTARAGSLYLNRSGGANTSVYYKETGTGNTGWVPISASLIVFGTDSTTTAATAVYMAAGYIAVSPATEIQIPVGRAATLRNLSVRITGAGTGSDTVTYTVRVNGVDTAIAASGANDAAAPVTISDTTNSVVVAAGDLISLKITKAGAVAAGQTGVFATLELS
jgi:hypothetical protein